MMYYNDLLKNNYETNYLYKTKNNRFVKNYINIFYYTKKKNTPKSKSYQLGCWTVEGFRIK